MKGYSNGYDYMGYLPSEGKYQGFETEDEYVMYYREMEEAKPPLFLYNF